MAITRIVDGAVSDMAKRCSLVVAFGVSDCVTSHVAIARLRIDACELFIERAINGAMVLFQMCPNGDMQTSL